MTAKSKCRLPLTMALSGVVAFSFGFIGCTRVPFSAPVPMTLAKPPAAVTTAQISADYSNDAAASDLKYKGLRLLFTNITVDDVSQQYFIPTYSGGKTMFTMYFTSGSIRFKLKDFNLMQSVEKGYILNIVGQCQGLNQGFVIIDDCWVQSIVGELNTTSAYVGAY